MLFAGNERGDGANGVQQALPLLGGQVEALDAGLVLAGRLRSGWSGDNGNTRNLVSVELADGHCGG